jgi:hypothetical protein
MKRFLILAVGVLMAGSAGCKCCGLCGGGAPTAVYRPTCPPPCTGVEAYPAAGTYAPAGTYAVPGATTTPALTAPPAQTIPGPEVYTPAN